MVKLEKLETMNTVQKRKLSNFGFTIAIIAVTIIAIIIADYSVIDGFTCIPRAISWATKNFYPNKYVMDKLPKILRYLLSTVLMAVAATSVASVFAGLLAFLGSETTRINKAFGVIARGVALLFRNIPVVAWAMILLFTFGQSDLTGFFALFFVTFGFLTRAFMESIDEAGKEAVEALKATGANWWQVTFNAVLPASMPQMISWILFMIETNIRSSTLVGMLTGTGVGFIFQLYYKAFHMDYNYNAASLVVVCIVITVFIIEFISNSVRRVIL